MRYLYILAACLFMILGCEKVNRYPDVSQPEKPTEKPEEKPEEPEDPPVGNGITPFTPADVKDAGVSYIWGSNTIPEITIWVTKDEWNSFLKRYDQNNNNADFFHCDVTFKKGVETITVGDAGFRMRGNTSRRRPEGGSGQMHSSKPDWHHCHFAVNLRKYHKDDDHTIYGIRKFNLKWHKDDPCYVREMYCYDLFRRYGIWTAPFDSYCRLWIHVDGDKDPAYFGVYELIESIDEEYVERRENQFENDKGHLWKCVYGNVGMADLKNAEDWRFNYDKNDGVNYTYEFKGKETEFETAREQFQDFITKLNTLQGEQFYNWIQKVCDVRMLMKTYAVNVTVGMWDDHWNNGNNFYLYFNSKDRENYKVWLIPYDYDNTLGTSADCGIQGDSGTTDPYKWGKDGVLIKRLLEFEPFRKMYREAFQELIDPANKLFDMETSIARITEWQNMIGPYVSNDTGEDMSIYDHPAHWSNRPNYRLMDPGANNFFRVKTEVLKNMK